MPQVLTFLAGQPILLLFVVIGLGSAIGRLKVRGVGLGAAGVLFLAIGLSAWASHYGINLQIPEALGTLGLTLFTFTVGIVSGATFFASLRRSLGPILSMVGVVVIGALVAVGMGHLLTLDAPTVAGAFAGAVTNTPALAAAQQAAGDPTTPTVGYAVTYLFGVVGMLAAVQLALRNRQHDPDTPPLLVNRTIRVEVGTAPSLRELQERHAHRITFSRVRHGEESPILTADDRDTLLADDLVLVVGPADEVDAVTDELGHASSHHLDLDRDAADGHRGDHGPGG